MVGRQQAALLSERNEFVRFNDAAALNIEQVKSSIEKKWNDRDNTAKDVYICRGRVAGDGNETHFLGENCDAKCRGDRKVVYLYMNKLAGRSVSTKNYIVNTWWTVNWAKQTSL